MQSCLYEGWVSHVRVTPRQHGFRYRLSWLYLDLSEVDTAFQGSWLWSSQRWAPARFRRADHLGDPAEPLQMSVARLLAEHQIEFAGGPIRLLTQPRYFGFVMNPVSFFYCLHPDESLQAVIAEVHNTPWGERHCYVLPAERVLAEPGAAPLVPKAFHVSPFMPMDLGYGWRMSLPGQTLRVSIENLRRGERFFQAEMELERRPLTVASLRRALWRFPLQTQRVYAGIYWQALKLWWKGCPYYPHPASGRPSDSSESARPVLPSANSRPAR